MNQIQRYLKKSGMKQIVFAKKIGVSEAGASMIIHGKIRPGRITALRISNLTGIPVMDLLFTNKEIESHR